MTNNSYRKGRDREYRIKKKLEELGYYVIRSAGSHGLFDLVAIDTENQVIYLLQVKAKTQLRTLKEYEEIKQKFEGLYEVKVRVITTAKDLMEENNK